MRRPKLYLETSVWNFFFADDAPEKKEITLKFFKKIETKEYEIFISDIVIEEIRRAEPQKRRVLLELVEKYKPKILEIDIEVEYLTKAYINEDIFSANREEDAKHAAVATIHEIDALISWNLKHLANFNKMEKINGVNLKEGYLKKIELITPMEVSEYEL